MTTKHIEGAETIRALKAQIEALTASQNACGSGAGCLHKDALIEVLKVDNRGWFHLSKKLEKERDAALALAADRRVDAERYKWLLTRAHWEDARDSGNGGRWWVSILLDYRKPTFGAAIDAARAAS